MRSFSQAANINGKTGFYFVGNEAIVINMLVNIVH